MDQANVLGARARFYFPGLDPASTHNSSITSNKRAGARLIESMCILNTKAIKITIPYTFLTR